ncbi:DUF397 domain-containing protein [Streptomyces sp. RY43-2]|uniref:DUF397 domain-containing protein n=1 Tax=Streptomyces macrolidinus TaxID=2952607 RepID=A0ABT0ZL65_9ACTN|nr:DUF397 domain-containing protein [Streptomyces macrolidinus]MCN9244329.1 DUF397 domain-containing protein [Streptomyces macrolidinus]
MSAKKDELYARDLADALWVKSSKSNRPGCPCPYCVEVADLGDGAVAVRDSRRTDLPALRFTAEEWAAFRDGVRDGEFG